ncbi:hypothetical protein [Metallosphaera sp.]|uniref:hypothetical protein n=1 Tax=Metallosphaera sp. TaxID=2020860 RepID=UPI00317825BF
MKRSIGDFVVQNDELDKPMLSVDYENAMNGEFPILVREILNENLKKKKNPFLDRPLWLRDENGQEVLIPTINPFIIKMARDYTQSLTNFTIYVIEGEQGAGKSSMVLQILSGLYGYSQDDPLRNFELALYFNIIDPLQLRDFILFLEKQDLRVPAILLDDAQVFFGSHTYWSKRNRYQVANDLITLLRPRVSSVIITMPTTEQNLHKMLRTIKGIYYVYLTRDNKRKDYNYVRLLVENNLHPEYYAQWKLYTRTMIKNYLKKEDIIYNEIKPMGENVVDAGRVRASTGLVDVRLPKTIYDLYTLIRNSYIELLLEEDKKRFKGETENIDGDSEDIDGQQIQD